MSKVKQWTENGSYTTQTKTLWYLAKLHFELATAGLFKFTNDNVDFLISEMKKLGYTNLNKTSVTWYLGAVNGTIIKDRLKESKQLQNDVNQFRKSVNLPIIKFGKSK
jgi:hypothetical protein